MSSVATAWPELPEADRFHAGRDLVSPDLSAELKAAKKEGREERLVGKNVALIFEKDRPARAAPSRSPRTTRRARHLSARAGRTWAMETAKDTARVLGRMYDAIEFHGFAQEVAEELAECSGVPVYNGLTDECTRRRSSTSSPSASTATSRSGDCLLLPRRRALQHGRQLPRRGDEAGDGRQDREPEVALAAR
jgi:hypothetical protein